MAQNKQTGVVRMLTSDNQIIAVDMEVAEQMETIRDMLVFARDCEEKPFIPLANVNTRMLNKVIVWIKKLLYIEKNIRKPQDTCVAVRPVTVGLGNGEGDTQQSKEIVLLYSEPFFSWRWQPSEVFRIMLAANYLGVFSLLDASAQWVADQIANCDNTQQVREKFHIRDDLTSTEKHQIRRGRY